jgi:hypothetical protein
MSHPRTTKITIWILAIVLLISLGCAGYLFHQNFFLELEAMRYADSAARLEAQGMFRKGFLWLYKIDGECDEDHFSGNREGPFEIWIKFYQPAAGPAHRRVTQRWVETFNDQMRRMQKEPEKFKKRLGADQ